MFSRGSFFSNFFSVIFLVSFSCTIIQDGDITSPDQLSTLKWKAVQIVQDTNIGYSSTPVQLVFDSVKNVVDPSSGLTVTRKMKFNLPSLNNKKMRLKSGSKVNTDLYISYKADNQPVNLWIQEGDSVIESYGFRYNGNILNKLLTRINPVDGLKETVRTSDSLIYDNSNKVTSVVRKSSDVSKAGTISITYQNSIISAVGFKYSYQIISGNCPNGGAPSNTCGGYQSSPSFSGSSPYMNYQFENINSQVSKIELTDRRFDFNNTNCQGCGRELDTFYLHPLMLTKNQFATGDQLMMIYMVDWWLPGTGAVANPQLSKNDVVTLNFQYGH